MSSDAPAVAWRRSKLMIVGEGEVGKSATLDSLLGRAFETGKASTVGAATEEEFCVDCSDVQEWTLVDTSESKEAARALAALAKGGNNNRTGREASRAMRIQIEALDSERVPVQVPSKENKVMQTKVSKKVSKKDASSKATAKANEGETKESKTTNHSATTVGSTRGAEKWQEFEYSALFDDHAQFLQDVEFAAAAENQNEDAITFSAWDFGGQKVFYALHHAFLSSDKF